MNINFLIDKEEERVIVSNKKGTMKPREYQDNIKEILIKEDVVEELEQDYKSLKINRVSLEGRLEDTIEKIKKCKKEKKGYWIIIFFILFGIPPLLEIFLYLIVEQFGIVTNLAIGATIDVFLSPIIYLLIRASNSPFVQIKVLKKEKEEFEKYKEEVDLEIAALVQVITKNKAELDELREQKEKNNIDRMPIDVQQISYREALEQELSYLTQLQQDTKADEQEETEKNSSILGRFKKKKR